MFRQEVRYLGVLVSEDGCRMDPADTEAVHALKTKTPRTVGDLRELLGFISYRRRFLPDFSRKAKPLYNLKSSKKPEKIKGRPKKNKNASGQLPSRTSDDT